MLTHHLDKAPTPPPDDDSTQHLLLSDLPDPLGRYEEVKKNPACCGYEMELPPVFDSDGNIVPPPQYQRVIPDGTLVAVHGSMKM